MRFICTTLGPCFEATRLRSWLAAWGWLVCLCACAAWPMPGRADIPPAALNADGSELAGDALQNRLNHIRPQLSQLRPTVVPPAQISWAQSQALQKHIAALERQQQQLADALAQAQNQHMQHGQQMAQLQTNNRLLQWALAVLSLALGALGWRAWHARQALRTAQVPVPVHQCPPHPVEAAPPPASEPPAVPDTAPTLVDVTPLPPAATSWTSLVSADLNDTQQALAQARQGFMQPARIDS